MARVAVTENLPWVRAEAVGVQKLISSRHPLMYRVVLRA